MSETEMLLEAYNVVHERMMGGFAQKRDTAEQVLQQKLELSPQEKSLIINALWAVMPYGGGSPQFHLAQKLEDMWGVRHSPEEAGRLTTIAVQEYEDAMNPG